MICNYVTNTKKHTETLFAQSYVAMPYENLLINQIYLKFVKYLYLRYGIMYTIITIFINLRLSLVSN